MKLIAYIIIALALGGTIISFNAVQVRKEKKAKRNWFIVGGVSIIFFLISIGVLLWMGE